MVDSEMHGAGKAVKFFARGLHLLAAIVIVLLLTYIMGNKLLSGPLQGNDSPLHVAYATWLNSFFPSIPHWYPLQAGGSSLLHGYPILPHLLVVIVHRLSSLSILQAFNLISFAGFPLTSMGIYLLCWLGLRRQNIGLIAACLYLLAPITWTWLYDWGFFPQHVAIIFLPLVLLSFIRSLDHRLAGRQGGRRRLWFAALVLSLLFIVLSHIIVAAAALIGIVLYIVLTSAILHTPDLKSHLASGATVIIRASATVGLVIAAYILPYYMYNRAANPGLANTAPIAVEQLHRILVPEFLGIAAIDPTEILTRMQFPFTITFLALLGLVLAPIGIRAGDTASRKALALALAVVVASIYALTPSLGSLLSRIYPALLNFISFRSMLVLLMVLLPIVAAYGVSALARVFVYPEEILKLASPIGYRPRQQRGLLKLRPAVAAIASTLVASGFILWTPGLSDWTQSTVIYGPYTNPINTNDIWNRGDESNPGSWQEQIKPDKWPPILLGDDDPRITFTKHYASRLPADRPLRVDVSPYHGFLVMDLATYADVSQINSYNYLLPLDQALWAYQQSVFFSMEEPPYEYGNVTSLEGASRWYGINYAFLHSEKDDIGLFEAAGWELEFEDGPIQLWRNQENPVMATIASRPSVLIVGKPQSDAYTTIFRMANDGMLPYEEAFLVEGTGQVDQYALEDLKVFDAVVLYGYDYENSNKAWETLSLYVEQGGNLFIDTGWEYWIPEWEFEIAPDVLPVNRLTWTDYGMAEDYSIDSTKIAGDVTVGDFKALVWEGKPWTLSGAEMTDIKDWGKVVLSAAGRPLVVAGEYGQGKVVWSGMNLIAHVRYGQTNDEEMKFLGNLMRWLVSGNTGIEMQAPLIYRDHPDRVTFSVETVPGEQAWLYWREAYYPNWHAYLSDENSAREIPVYRGGPGFMLMPVEASSELVTVSLRWELSTAEVAAYGVSALGLILLVGIGVDGLFLGGNGLTWLKIAALMRVPRPFLGRGDNHEWAERKRRELEAGESPQSPVAYQPSEAIPWMSDQTAPASGSSEPGDDLGEGEIERGSSPIPEDHEKLLESWLSESGHSEDAWAENLIKKRQPNEET